jgi:hypothetical protein
MAIFRHAITPPRFSLTVMRRGQAQIYFAAAAIRHFHFCHHAFPPRLCALRASHVDIRHADYAITTADIYSASAPPNGCRYATPLRIAAIDGAAFASRQLVRFAASQILSRELTFQRRYRQRTGNMACLYEAGERRHCI